MQPIKFLPPISTPDFAKLQKTDQKLIFDGAPLFYRTNGSNGTFACGEQEIGQTLYMQLLDWRWTDATRWKGDRQWWIDILFVDNERNVSLLCLKKDSAQRFNAWIKGLKSAEEFDVNPRSIWIRMEMQSRQVEVADNPISTYYVPVPEQWSFVSEQNFAAAEDWFHQQFHYSNDIWIVPGENIVHQR
jgi:hypothetical protein